MLNEVHGDGIPGTRRDGELFDQTVGLVSRGFGSSARGAGGTKVFDELSDSGPSILSAYELRSLVHAKVSSEEVIVLVLKNSQVEILRVWDV